MTKPFYAEPILNSPYLPPTRHHALGEDGQPLEHPPIEGRRRSKYVTPVPKARRSKAGSARAQTSLTLDAGEGSTSGYNPTPIINEIRGHLESWRALPNPNDWGVTPVTQRLLQHWRHHEFSNQRPFFCQIEAVETAIWLAEVARGRKQYAHIFRHLQEANRDANPDLFRLALKLATGAGKTTVMAMLIAWQAINAARQPNSSLFSRGFLLVAPGITIKDRLRVLNPSDTDNYYRTRELVPAELMTDLGKAKIVITNYHAFQRRKAHELNPVGERLMQGRTGQPIEKQETEGEMLQRACGELLPLKNIVVINDEAHHCYRERPGTDEEAESRGEEKDEAKKNNEAARLWISGLEALKRKVGLRAVYDLSATPFFLRGSGYEEGTLFPWVVSDFSLVDAIECGIVKLPRVPVADNAVNAETPVYRNLWDHIGKAMPKKGAGKSGDLDPLSIPAQLQTALISLYSHYEKEFEEWERAAIGVPPVFIVVCNNTASSKLVYEWVSGWQREREGQMQMIHRGHLGLFSNFDQYGNPLPRMNTLLIDSEQIESGEALDANFREMAKGEIEQFRREKQEREGAAAGAISDSELLREVMNTVGQKGRLGEQIRCVVSVSMLTEGWDANTVTHILGVRAFGTQLLCEQVIGRGLRRQSYELNPETGLFETEYADTGLVSPRVRELHKGWWEGRIARQKEIDESIARAADVEMLYDRPYEDKTKVRVAGPFTVESLSPHRVVTSRDDTLAGELSAAEGTMQPAPKNVPDQDFGRMVLDHLRSAGVHSQERRDTIHFNSVEPWPGNWLAAARVDGLGKRLLAKQGVERPTTDTRRLVGAVDAAVKGLISEGHTATSRPDLLQSLGRKVGSLSEQAIDAGISVGALIADAELLRFPGCALMEDACLAMLRELCANAMPLPRSVLKDFRDGTLVQSDGLHAEQHAAALRVLLHPVACLQGGAGTGKSFVTRTICAAWEASGGSVVLAALSGKAALRLSRASGRLAMTLARLLRNLEAQCETDGAKSSAAKDEDAVVLDDRTLVVVDEAAMVDLPTMYRLLGYMNGHGRLLLVGDDAQLPPIGFGLVYHRLVEDVETTARLTVVHRQSGESGIPSVAASIRERLMPALSAYAGKAEGVSFVDVRGDGIAEAVELVSDDLGGFGQGELMVVTATNGGPAGIDELNSRLQRQHVERNGHTVVKGSLGQWFAPADPCIHLRNDYSLGLFNGSTGQVVEVSEEDRAVTAEIDGRRFRFTSQIAGDDAADGDLVDLGLAYALTCHKAQGSQCSRVIVPVYRTALLTPSWLYTAVTRAEHQVVLVGEREAMELALSRPWVGEARTVGFRH